MAVMDVKTPLRELRTEHTRGSQPPRLTRMPAALLRQGVLGYVLALVAAWFLASREFVLPVNWTYAVVSIVAIWLLYSFAALPAFERARSFKPSIRLVEVAGVASVGCLLAEVNNTEQLRQAVIAVVAAPAVLMVSALLHRQFLRRTPTILVGETGSVERLAERWAERPDVNVVATCSWRASHERAGVMREVVTAVDAFQATSVVIASGRAFTSPALRQLAWGLQRAEVECLVVADMNDHVEYVRPRRVGDQVALSLRAPNDHLMSLVFKSLFDRSVSLLALIVLSPLLLLIGLMVRLGSRGPAIFRQERSGRDGVPFSIWKFRTMDVDAEEQLVGLQDFNEGAGPLFKIAADPRVTRLGAFLRKTSLDELPQLVNVLKGEMSLVGPRPALPAETSQYDEWMWRRLHVLPGMTGLWQVSGRSSLSWEESIRMDLQYVNNWNLRLDASILARTVRAVVAQDGAL